jgi:NAD(P)-dependent dehydrogenase (short-subunit alcohol dehydrogenase family)
MLVMGYSLAGRNALITGASQGLGLAIARAYVKAGAAVLLCARDTEMLDEARRQLLRLASSGQTVSAQVADVSSPEDVNRYTLRRIVPKDRGCDWG